MGETVTFPTAVKDSGFIFKAGSEIAMVVGTEYQVVNFSYGTRLQWDPSTGLFSISGLRRADFGEFRVLERNGPSKTYQLAVWGGCVRLGVRCTVPRQRCDAVC